MKNEMNVAQHIAASFIEKGFDDKLSDTLIKGGVGSGKHKVGDIVKIDGNEGVVKHINGDKVKVKLNNGSTSYHHHSKVIGKTEDKKQKN